MNKLKLIRSIRLSLALIISLIYIKFTNVGEGIWVPMTCSIILSSYNTVGGTMIKSYERFIGSLLAIIIAFSFIILFANNFITNIIAVICCVFIAIYFFIDKQNYIAGLLTWTPPIILFNNNNYDLGFLRMTNIIIGIIIAYLLLRLFYPIYARNEILKEYSNILSQANIYINKILQITTQKNQVYLANKLHPEEESKFTKLFTNANKLLQETKLETRKHPRYFLACQKLQLELNSLDHFAYILIYHLNHMDNFINNNLKTDLEQINNIIAKIAEVINLLLENDNNSLLLTDNLSQNLNTLYFHAPILRDLRMHLIKVVYYLKQLQTIRLKFSLN